MPAPCSIPRVSVGLEENLDAGDCIAIACAIEPQGAIDEALDSFVAIGVQRAAGNDQQPAGVPNRTADQPAVIDRLGRIEIAAVMESAEPSEAADGCEF